MIDYYSSDTVALIDYYSSDTVTFIDYYSSDTVIIVLSAHKQYLYLLRERPSAVDFESRVPGVGSFARNIPVDMRSAPIDQKGALIIQLLSTRTVHL